MLMLWAWISLAAPAPDSPAAVLADPFFSEPRTEARDATAVLQNRKYEDGNELTLLVGALPVDAFYKGLTVTAGYTHHFSDAWAWEVVNATHSFNFDTNLKKEVLRFREASFPEIQWIAASHLVWKPLYGKEAIFNTSVVHLEAYLQAGPAAVLRSDQTSRLRPGGDLGVGVRLWLDTWVSWRLDLRELAYVAGSVETAFLIQTGLAFELGGGA